MTDTDVFAGKIYAGPKCMRLVAGGAGGVDIDPKVKYTFRFVSDTIPSVGGIFLIHGQRYVCQRITATFSDSGMSQVLKGEFFRVIR